MCKTVSATGPECGVFAKGGHERQSACEAHTACDRHGWILGVEVTAGNANGSTAWDAVYGQVTGRFPEAAFIVMDAGCKTPWIAKKPLEDNRIPILPYTRCKGRKDRFRPWDFTYDRLQDCFACPKGQALRHTTTGKDGKRMHRSSPKLCQCCPCRQLCSANGKGQRLLMTHIGQEHLDLAEQLRKARRPSPVRRFRQYPNIMSRRISAREWAPHMAMASLSSAFSLST